jgi:hypothetical protein
MVRAPLANFAIWAALPPLASAAFIHAAVTPPYPLAFHHLVNLPVVPRFLMERPAAENERFVDFLRVAMDTSGRVLGRRLGEAAVRPCCPNRQPARAAPIITSLCIEVKCHFS